MKLTGKCKEDFEKWFAIKSREDQYWYAAYNKFDLLPDSMQYGVCVDFFDSVGIKTTTSTTAWVVVAKGKRKGEYGNCNSRPEARDAAIKKANELYNL
jgi:hypothetical protein